MSVLQSLPGETLDQLVEKIINQGTKNREDLHYGTEEDIGANQVFVQICYTLCN